MVKFFSKIHTVSLHYFTESGSVFEDGSKLFTIRNIYI